MHHLLRTHIYGTEFKRKKLQETEAGALFMDYRAASCGHRIGKQFLYRRCPMLNSCGSLNDKLSCICRVDSRSDRVETNKLMLFLPIFSK